MKTSLIFTFTVSLVFLQGQLFSQTIELDSIQIERIAKVSQLWGHLKYFHPYLSDKIIDWESAYTEHIDGVIKAESREDFGEAVQKMLDPLNDPSTRVLMDQKTSRGMSESNDTIKYPTITFVQDSLLLFSLRDYSDMEDFYHVRSQFLSLMQKAPQSKGIIFDIRGLTDAGEMKGYLSYYFGFFEKYFSDEAFQLPGLRARLHDGFAPESGGTSGGYYSGLYTKEQKTIIPGPQSFNKPMVFIANEYAEIPMVALGLQLANRAKIISTYPLTDASVVETTRFPLEESLEVSVRLNELPPEYEMKADYLFSTSTEDQEILNIASQILRGENPDLETGSYSEKKSSPAPQKEANESANTSYPDLEQRLLAAAKIWTVIDYFFAYQDLMEDDWNEVLKDYIPLFASAKDSLEYNLVIAEMYTHIQDGHGFIRSPILNAYFGVAFPPIKIRFIEEQAVVAGMLPDSVFEVKGVEIGDIILEIDEEKATDRFRRLAKYTSSSNPSWLNNSISRRFLNGEDESEVLLKIKKADGRTTTLSLPRKTSFSQPMFQLGRGRNDQAITRLINENIGYADLDRLTVDMVDQMFADFKNTQAIIFDMRGYPNGTAWAIAPYLTAKKDVYAANFRRYAPMSMNLGSTKHMTIFDQAIPPSKFPTYTGKTVMLIDERTISQAEHTGLFFEAANGTVFIGSQTAGANGDVTNFQIPGNISLSFSGHDVRHIDGSQLQKIGLVPELEVKPTIKGIRAGKDEVLEKAVEYVTRIIKQ